MTSLASKSYDIIFDHSIDNNYKKHLNKCEKTKVTKIDTNIDDNDKTIIIQNNQTKNKDKNKN